NIITATNGVHCHVSTITTDAKANGPVPSQCCERPNGDRMALRTPYRSLNIRRHIKPAKIGAITNGSISRVVKNDFARLRLSIAAAKTVPTSTVVTVVAKTKAIVTPTAGQKLSSAPDKSRV